MIKIIPILLFVSLTIAQNPTVPIWPEVFQQTFTESYPITTDHVNGKVYYDSKNNLMRVDRHDGQYDMFCGSVLPYTSTSCTLLMRENKRYIIYPEKRMCCYCCDDLHGCGVPQRDFLKTSKYQGYQVVSGQSYYKWRFPVGQDSNDYYYDTPDSERIPKRFTNQNKTITDFNTGTFSKNPIPDTVFTLPSYCTYVCPAKTICGKLSNQQMNLKLL